MATMGCSGTSDAALVGSELRATISMAVPKMHTTMMPIAIGRLTVKCFIPKFFIAKCFVTCFAKCFTVKRVERFAGMSPPWGKRSKPSRVRKRGTAAGIQGLSTLSVGGRGGWEDRQGCVEKRDTGWISSFVIGSPVLVAGVSRNPKTFRDLRDARDLRG